MLANWKKILLGATTLSLIGVPAFAEINISDAYSYETAPSQTVGMAAMNLVNTGDSAEKLVSVTAPEEICDLVEIHSMTEENGVMKMRKQDALDIPAGETVTLSHMGYHLMLMGLKKPLAVNEEIPLTLTFETGETAETRAIVRARVAKPDGPPAHKDHAGHDMMHDMKME